MGNEDVANLTVSVSSPSGCQWTAASNAGWLEITNGASGSGNGTVRYRVSDFNGSSRTGTLTIAGRTFTVTQVRCSATLTPSTQSVSALGGVFSVSLATQIGCPWQAVESLNWVNVANPRNGTGSATVSYTVSANLGAARTGTISIAGVTLTINQAAVLP